MTSFLLSKLHILLPTSNLFSELIYCLSIYPFTSIKSFNLYLLVLFERRRNWKAEQLDCPRSGPGQVRGIFSGPGPGPPGPVQSLAGPGPGPHWTGSIGSGSGSGQVRTWTWLIFFLDSVFITNYIVHNY